MEDEERITEQRIPVCWKMPAFHAMNLEPEHCKLPARILMILLGVALSLSAYAQPKLVMFADANGCKLLGTAGTVKRLHEIAAQGSVTWEGQCKGGLIDGEGVLRQEGALTIDGRTRKYAYFFSGIARNGLRQGNWQRETFDRFAGSQTFYTSAATLEFSDGVAGGSPALFTVGSLDQLTPRFRKFVIDAQTDARPANAALLHVPAGSTSSGPAGVAPAAAASGKSQVAGAPASRSLYSYFPRVTASSQYEQFGSEGLMTFQRPGWYSAKPPAYPEWILVDFRGSRDVATIGVLAEDGQQARAPKTIRIESSQDGKAWTTMTASENPCAPTADGSWSNYALRSSVIGRYLKIVILANCGDPDHVTVRGLRFD